jgi:hypothetical protein
MKSMIRAFAISLAIFMTGCVTTPSQDAMPSPTSSEFFQTLGGGFASHGNTVAYAVQVQPKKLVNASKPWFAQIEFENPSDRKKPLVQIADFPADQARFSLHSDALYVIKNHKTYKVTLKAFSDPERTILITAHEMDVRFDIPDELAAAWGLKLL